jgi:hypothetical protein
MRIYSEVLSRAPSNWPTTGLTATISCRSRWLAMTGCGHRAKPSGGNQADRILNRAAMFTSRLSLRRSSIFSQPAEKEDINEGGDKRKNPGKHLRKPSRIETVHIARIGRSARLSTGNAAGKLDSERDLRMGAPKPVRHRGRKNNQQQRKQGYAAFLWRYRLHFFFSGPELWTGRIRLGWGEEIAY